MSDVFINEVIIDFAVGASTARPTVGLFTENFILIIVWRSSSDCF